MHVPRGDDPDQGSLAAKRKRHMQPAATIRACKGLKALLRSAVLHIDGDQRLVEEDLLRLRLTNVVLVNTLAA